MGQESRPEVRLSSSMTSLWMFLIICLSPPKPMIFITPTTCGNVRESSPEKSRTFVFDEKYEDKRVGFHEVQFKLNISCTWSGIPRGVSPSSTKSISGKRDEIYSKTETFLNEMTKLLPNIDLNLTSVLEHGSVQVKRHRSDQRIEKRLHIGIYQRHHVRPRQDFDHGSGDRTDLESNVSNFGGIMIPENGTFVTDIGSEDVRGQDNCTHRSGENSNCIDDVVTAFRSRWPVHLWISQDLSMINTHWMRFPPPPAAAHYSLAVLYGVIMILGILGNGFVIYMVLRCRSLRTPANILVMNLAVSDLMMLSKMPVFIYNSIYMGPALGYLACQVYGFLGGITGTVSIMTIASIAADRYQVVAEPFKRTTYAKARITVAMTWVYGGAFAGLPLLVPSLGGYTPEGYLTSCSFDYLNDDRRVKIFILCFFAAAWLVPFAIILYSYFGIIRIVMAARHIQIGDQTSETRNKHYREEEKRRTELRFAVIVIGIIGMWFVSWSPYAVVALMGVFGQSQMVTQLGSMIPALLCKTASCLDPYVYAITHPRFRGELRHLTKRSRRKRSAKQWSPQPRGSRKTKLRVSQGANEIGSVVYEDGKRGETFEIVSTASRPSMSKGSNCSPNQTTNHSYQRSSAPSFSEFFESDRRC